MGQNKSILENLNAFIRKYYMSRLIRGLLYGSGLILSLFLLFVAIEYFGYFGTLVRTIIFWAFLLIILLVLAFYVLLPILRMHRLAGGLSYEQAARLAGEHFPEIKDKLLNLLQLQQLNDSSPTPEQDLLAASIEQKTALIRLVPLKKAVNLKVNVKYIKYAAIPLLVLLALFIIFPAFITAPAERIVNHNTRYERPAPFSFVLENSDLYIPQQEDFPVSLSVVGSTIPEEVFIFVDNLSFKMQKVDATHFSYTIKNVQHSHTLHFEGGGVSSGDYTLTVYPKATILNFRVAMTYPAYTAKQAEVLINEGDIVAPEGSNAKWLFQMRDVDTLYFMIDSVWTRLTPDKNGRIEFAHRISRSFIYAFSVANSYTQSLDTLRYTVTAVPDAYPLILVLEARDSVYPDRAFFRGNIKDDYGFSKLQMVVNHIHNGDTAQTERLTYPVAVSRETTQEFIHSYNFAELNLLPGDALKYYFEVWDNDGVHGPKMARSQEFVYNIPTDEELDERLSNNAEEAYNKAESSMSDLRKLQEEINELMRKFVDKKELSWQDKNELKELANKQKELQKKLEQMKQRMEENNRLREKYRDQEQQILDKQKELERMMESLLNDEMKKMMEEIDKMMQEMEKDKIQEQLEQLKMSNEDLEKQLDQNLELMKRLELENRVSETIDKTRKLSEKQQEMSSKTESSKGKNNEELKQQQQQLNKEFQDLKQDLQDIKNEYKKLDPSEDFKIDQSLENKIENNQNNASQQMNKGNNKNAAQSQQEAAQQLDSLANEIAEEQQRMEQEDMAEDAGQIRQLLASLVTLSFNQEGLIGEVSNTYIQDPKYQTIILSQNQIKDNFGVLEDSLRAIAKRQVTVASAIGKELGEVNLNIKKSLDGLLTYNQSFYGNSKNTGTSRWMQSSMTSLNNLALLLAESLNQMQQQSKMKSNSSCKNPSKQKSKSQCNNPGKNPSPKSMRKMQEELNKQMEALKKQLDKQGKPSARHRLGEQGTMSEEFAKMAAQQEMIRRMMQQYGQELKEGNMGDSKLAKEIEQLQRQMEQTETDLVNKTITNQTISRQQQIMTRLLEHEKAEMQREKEQRRESRESADDFPPPTSDMQQIERLKQRNMETLKRTVPNLNNFYKQKVNDYFFRSGNENNSAVAH